MTIPAPTSSQRPNARRLLWRAGGLRCPNCGGGPLFSRWVIMRQACPRCHLRLDRGESDYFLGAYTVNFVTAELLVVFAAVLAIVFTWPDVPWETIKLGLFALVVAAPVLFYPFAKTLWLALDLFFRPLTPADLEGSQESALPR